MSRIRPWTNGDQVALDTGRVPVYQDEKQVDLQDGSGNALSSDVNDDRDTNLDGVRGLNTNAMMFGRVDDDTVKNARLDAVTEALMTVTYPHHEGHAGTRFEVTVNDTGTSLILAWKTPASGPKMHFTFKWKSEETGTVALWEGATWTTSTGTDFSPRNVNRSSGNTSLARGDASGAFVAGNVVIDPTGLATGSAINLWPESTWATNQAPANTGEGGREEKVLAFDTNYALQLTAGNGGLWLHMDWYEHADRNV